MRIENRKRPMGRSRLRWIEQIRENFQERRVEWTTVINEEF